MTKNLPIIEGKFSYLRELTLDDSEFIVKLRSNKFLTKYINSGPFSVSEQINWYKKYELNESDHSFIVILKNKNIKIGTIALYNIDFINKKAEVGRWIVKNNPIGAIESLYLIYKYAFERLNLYKVYFDVVTENVNVINIHTSYGALNKGISDKKLYKDNKEYSHFYFEVTKDIYFNKAKDFFKRILYKLSS